MSLTHWQDIARRARSPAEAAGAGAPDGLEVAIRAAGRWERRLRDESPDPEAYDKRLTSLGLTRRSVEAYLAGPAFAPLTEMPAWAALMRAACDAVAPAPAGWDDFTDVERGLLPQPPDELPLFPGFLWPYARAALARSSLDAGLRPAVARVLLYQLSFLAAPALAHAVRRARDAGLLHGDSPAARYRDHFERVLATPAAHLAFWKTYPVLARHVGSVAGSTVAALDEALGRWRADRAAVAELFGRDPGEPVGVHPGLSDPHHGRRTVVLFAFAGGERLIYKPRSLHADAALVDLVSAWNAAGAGPTLRACRVIDRGEYGWAEFLETAECADAAEAAAYYRRQGAWSALLYFLGGVDFHSENFLACGPFPVPIDLEGVLAPWPGRVDGRFRAVPPWLRPVGFSPQPTGLWPTFLFCPDGRPLAAVSGIAGTMGRGWPDATLRWVGLGTDWLHVKPAAGRRAIDQSLPRLRGQAVGADGRLADVADGFAAMYRWLVREREALWRPGGPVERLAAGPARCMVRHTQEYKEILLGALAPECLTDGALHDVALEPLSCRPVPVGDSFGVADREKEALWRRDVPLFRGLPDGRAVELDGGVVGEVPAAPALELARERWDGAGEDELGWLLTLQTGMIRLGLTRPRPAAPDADDPDPFRTAARSLGETLAGMAIRCPDGVVWPRVSRAAPPDRTVYASLSEAGLYDGAAGVALFLAHLAEATGEERWADLAAEGLRFADAQTRAVRWPTHGRERPAAALEGPLGVAYAWAEAGPRLGLPWRERALDLALRFGGDADPAGAAFDVVAGAAGDLLLLLHLYRRTGEAKLLPSAGRLAEGLAARAGPRELGMAHGRAGLVHALTACDGVAGLPDVRAAASAHLTALAERYHDGLEDWPDLRWTDEPVASMSGWCGGAPGIGLALARLPGAGELSEKAVAATRRHLGRPIHQVCCGLAGRLWFLAEAGHLAEARRGGAELLAFNRSAGLWDHGDFHDGDLVTGLFRGAAGLGLLFLHLRRPETVSRVLTLN